MAPVPTNRPRADASGGAACIRLALELDVVALGDTEVELPLDSVARPVPESLALRVDPEPDAPTPETEEVGIEERVGTEESEDSVPMLVLIIPLDENVSVETEGGCEARGDVSDGTGALAAPDMLTILYQESVIPF